MHWRKLWPYRIHERAADGLPKRRLAENTALLLLSLATSVAGCKDAHIQHGEQHLMVELRDQGYIEINGLHDTPDAAQQLDQFYRSQGCQAGTLGGGVCLAAFWPGRSTSPDFGNPPRSGFSAFAAAVTAWAPLARAVVESHAAQVLRREVSNSARLVLPCRHHKQFGCLS